jgi:cation transport ATPase
MNTNQQNNQPESNQSGPDYSNRRAARWQRIEERRARRYSVSWVIGVILILAGFFIMLQNLTSYALENWWALFILIPAIGAFGNVWRTYQSNNHLSASARVSLIGGIILVMVTAVFLFNLNWTILGPILLILAGMGLLINVILPD